MKIWCDDIKIYENNIVMYSLWLFIYDEKDIHKNFMLAIRLENLSSLTGIIDVLLFWDLVFCIFDVFLFGVQFHCLIIECNFL